MRQERTVQGNIFDLFATHDIGHELKAMSQWLDEQHDLLGLVARDLVGCSVTAPGRQGLPAEAVLRCALLKQYWQLTYQELQALVGRQMPAPAATETPRPWTLFIVAGLLARGS
ncbi:hypothetical protein X767_32625 [Mesorhizobium sp. LSJC264A00]|nr:hypothetical protein X767_32625 [Mesorhizobium sp. LSJC264A00]